jgi:hypothetical protein
MKRLALLTILPVALLSLILGLAFKETPAAEDQRFDYDLLVVRAYFDDYDMVEGLATWIEPWEVNLEQGYVIVDVSAAGYDRLVAAGFRVEIDEKLTAEINEPRVMLPGQDSGIPGFPCYRTVEETFNTAQQLTVDYPQLATWIDIGDSWDKTTPGGPSGYDLMVLRLTNGEIVGTKPVLYVFGSIHAREYAAAELATRFAEHLVSNYDVEPDITWLLDYHEIHLVLQANPDGRKKAEAGILWRKNTNNSDGCTISNLYGVDLNRNFEFYWNNGGSSSDPCDIVYRGSEAASEPESQAYQNYGWSILQDQRDDPITVPAPITTTGIFIDLHSYGEEIFWSWGWTSAPPPNHSGTQTLARKMGYFNGYDANHHGYTVSGTTKDFFYGEFGVPGYTIELGTWFFQSCGYFENTIVPDNFPSLLYAAKASRYSYITPSGPDAVEISLPSATVPSGNPIEITATINDTRYNNSQGTEPNQDIMAAEYYIDLPPWVTATMPISVPMTPVDGTYDSSIEAVQATIDTTGLANGRHIIFVRGKDVLGNWGAIGSAFLFVIDPAVAPLIQGRVTAADTGFPLSATVSAGQYFQTTTDPVGFYQMRVISGTYDITAEPDSPGYGRSTVTGIVAHDQQTIQQEFNLYPLCTIFGDDVESGNLGWTADSPWTITAESSNSPTHSWTDSQGGNYSNNLNASLTSPLLDISSFESVTLNLWQICNTEVDYDYCHVEVSTDGGSSWSTIANYDNSNVWQEITVPAETLNHQSVALFRFRLRTDGGVTDDGWHIDDISLLGAGPNCVIETVPSASFESSSPDPLGTTTVFTNNSTGGNLNFEWDFGDGSPLNTDANPTHLYTLTGTYTVTMTATNSLGSDVATGLVEITELAEKEFYLPLMMANINSVANKP